jgi:hypothetical protein
LEFKGHTGAFIALTQILFLTVSSSIGKLQTTHQSIKKLSQIL